MNEKIAEEFLPLLKKKLVDDRREAGVIPVELRLCDKSAEIIGGRHATEQDFDTEFLDYILAVKIVRDTDEAIKHIPPPHCRQTDVRFLRCLLCLRP